MRTRDFCRLSSLLPTTTRLTSTLIITTINPVTRDRVDLPTFRLSCVESLRVPKERRLLEGTTLTVRRYLILVHYFNYYLIKIYGTFRLVIFIYSCFYCVCINRELLISIIMTFILCSLSW